MKIMMKNILLSASLLAATAALQGCASVQAGNGMSLSPQDAALMPGVIGGKDDFRAGDPPPAHPGEVVISAGRTGAEGKIPELRLKSITEAAQTYGSQMGYERRNWEIAQILQQRGPVLSQVFDFNRVVARAPGGAGIIIPPVVSAATDAFTVDSAGTEAAVADAYLTITRPGRIALNAPSWQEYLVSAPPKASQPARSLLPVDNNEKTVFQAKFVEGWDQGKRLADDELSARIARLQRDYHGMLQYLKLVDNGMMDRMVLTNADFGTTVNAESGEMRIGSRAVKITSEAEFQASPSRWSARNLNASNSLVLSGTPGSLGNMLP